MQYEVLEYLRCPVSKTKLRFELIIEFEKEYSDSSKREICNGILFSEIGFVFPIINGIPRILIESLYDYAEFFEMHLPNYQQTKLNIETSYNALLDYCISKNKKSKDSFEFEWSFLNYDANDKLWHGEISNLETVLTKEVDKSIKSFYNKKVIDVGSGHGIMTSAIGEISNFAIGVELSKAVEKAYIKNKCSRAWYIQSDLQFLPFEDSTFDVLYSSGVIHHTNNTHLSFLLLESLIKVDGRICLWLYHPQKSIIHNMLLSIRSLTKKMPLKIAFIFLLCFIFPVSYSIKKLKGGNSNNYREEIIDLLDQFTPEFRFEIPHDLATSWLLGKNYINIKITTEGQFGFSIVGDKNASKN